MSAGTTVSDAFWDASSPTRSFRRPCSWRVRLGSASERWPSKSDELFCVWRAKADACGTCSVCRRTEHTVSALPELRETALKELERSTGEAKDEATRLFNVRLHPDLILVQPSGVGRSESIKVAQVRDIVAEAAMRPFEGASRVVVVDSAHLLVEQGANAFLKTLEEPPADTHFILVSDSVDMLLRTIRSRCQILRMGPLSDEAVVAHLERDRGPLGTDEARLRASPRRGKSGSGDATRRRGMARAAQRLAGRSGGPSQVAVVGPDGSRRAIRGSRARR